MLMGGASLCFVRSPKKYFKILKLIGKEWSRISDKEINKKIKSLYNSKLVKVKTEKDGTIVLVLSNEGKSRVLRYKLEEMRIKIQRWDKKWRIVIFDIPEEQKAARDALRLRLKRLGFYELQKSVFVHPFDCKDEVDFITEFYQVTPFIRYGLLSSIDNDLHLRRIFDLS